MYEKPIRIREYGNVVNVTARTQKDAMPDVMEAYAALMDKQAAEIREVLDICGDAEIVEDFHLVEGPNVDVLKRWKTMGWYGRFSSANYEKLEAHFTCRRKHEPDVITLEYIQQIILRYAEQQRQYDEEDDDY